MTDHSWHAAQLPAPARRGNGTKVKSRVNWTVEWAEPHAASMRNISIPMEEAERRLCEIARAAVHHAVVSGKSSITITVTRAKPLGKEVR